MFHFFAGNNVQVPAGEAGVPTVNATSLISGITSAIFVGLGLICVLVIVFAGFRYVTSQGDSGTVAKAKSAILYAVIGLVVSLFAFAITQFVSDAVLNASLNNTLFARM